MTSRATLRVVVSLLVFPIAFGVNALISPQIYTPREPVFSGPDIASNWAWRSMANGQHSWWLWSVFPDASVRNVGFVSPHPNFLPVGIDFTNWIDQHLGLEVDASRPPYDVTQFGIREELLSEAKVFSRIKCRDNQAMVERDSCFYFVAWSDKLLPEFRPVFVGVRTLFDEDSEVALVEKNLLESLIPVDLGQVPDYHDIDS
jgi:hypothetical protein